MNTTPTKLYQKNALIAEFEGRISTLANRAEGLEALVALLRRDVTELEAELHVKAELIAKLNK